MQLNLEEVSCQKGGENLFLPVSFSLSPKELKVLAGPNGVGKTTLMEAIAGLSRNDQGLITHPKEHQDDAKGYWFVNSLYLGHKLGNKAALNCLENLGFVARMNQVQVDEHALMTALEDVGLSGFEYFLTSELSAGQKKRLSLARLKLLNKTFWLLDEPFVNLDYAGCDWLYKTIEQHMSQGGAILISAHDQKEIQQKACQIIELEQA